MQNTQGQQRTQPCDRMAMYINGTNGLTVQVPVPNGVKVAPTIRKGESEYSLITVTYYVQSVDTPITDETGRPISDDDALERIRMADAAGELTDLVKDVLEDAA